MKRIAQPEEIAEAILFLASNKASYITGASLAADGGNWLAKMKRAGQFGIPARAKLVAGNANHSGDALEHLRAGKARYRIVLVNDHA